MKSLVLFLGKQPVMLGTILAYLFLYWLNHQINFNLYWIPGLLLLYYFPGQAILSFFPDLEKNWGPLGRLGLAVFLSTTLVISVLFIMTGRIGLMEPTHLLVLLVGNSILFSAMLLINRDYLSLKTVLLSIRKNIRQFDRADLGVLGLFSLIFIVMVMINPLAQDADNFLTFFKNTLETRSLGSVALRPLFTYFLVSNYSVLGIPYTAIFRLTFVVLFYCSTLFLFDYARRTIVRPFRVIPYLLLLGAPVIITEINIIRPQVGLLIYVLPVIFLAIESIKKRAVWSGLIALWFSLGAMLFHELSIFLVVLAVIALLYNLVYATFWSRKISLRHYFWTLVVTLPYLIILPIPDIFSKVIETFHYSIKLFPGFHWQWWFIDHYKTIDNLELGWPGIQALYYYLYNGIILFFTVIVVLFVLLVKRKKTPFYFIIPLFFTIIFLIFAEILPRIGLFFLPNRAWPFLMLGIVTLATLIFEKFPPKKTLLPIYLVICLVGVAGMTYVGLNNIWQVYPQEIPAATYLYHKTPGNALILSTQDNQPLVLFYGQRDYFQLNRPSDFKQFEATVNQKLTDLSQPTVITQPETIKEERILVNNEIASKKTIVTQKASKKILPPVYQPGQPVYFIYSFRKINTISKKRPYLTEILDTKNGSHYLTSSYPIVFYDKNVLLLKLR